MSLRGLRILLEAWLRTIPFPTPEGTDIFRAFWRAGLRAWYLMMKHLVEAGADGLHRRDYRGRKWRYKAPSDAGRGSAFDESFVESSSDGELYPSVMREIEAVGKVWIPALVRLYHPHVSTELIPASKNVNKGLWVWSSEGPVDPKNVVVLYFVHGGGYCFFDGVISHLGLVVNIIETMQAKLRGEGWKDVVVVGYIIEYSLAPEKILPTPLEELVKGYKFLLTQERFPVKSDRIAVAGDSAGGGLELGFLKCLAGNFFCKDLPKPACCLALDPFVDFGPSAARKAFDTSGDFVTDVMLWHCATPLYGRPPHPGERMDTVNHPLESDSYVQRAGKFDDEEWVRVREMAPDHRMDKHPLFSVVYGDVSPEAFGNAPILVQAGSVEALYDDIARFVDKAKGSVCFEVYENMFHVFPIFSRVVPLGQTAIDRWAGFASKALRGQKMPLGEAYIISTDRVESLAMWGVSFRAWYLMTKHFIQAFTELARMAIAGETIKGEDVVTRLIQMPDEFNDKSSSDGDFLPEVMRMIEAVGNVWKPAMVRLSHPNLVTEPISATENVNKGLWVWSSESPVDPENVVVLYFVHGGGYCFFDGFTSHLGLAVNIIEAMQAKLRGEGWKDVVVVGYIIEYSLAPEKILPTPLEELVNGYKFLLTQKRFPVKSDRIAVAGDSAGGGLELGFLKCLGGNFFCKDLPRPACCLALDPFVDFAPSAARESYDISHDFLSNIMLWYCAPAVYGRPSHPGERLDTINRPLESDECIQKAGKFDDKEWVRVREMAPDHRMDKHPLFSVVYGDVSPEAFGNVPILVQAGSVEALYDDIARFADKARESVCFEVYENMFHVFPAAAGVIPLGRTAINRWADFASKALKGEKLPLGKAYAISTERVEAL
ncbi:hypothetical protein FOL46_006603 [Perkinsus olseni]|uniref:Alpha/beta hydrolase fold-3 domain-containing protein n=1 Tax=Perkinsus olseni TaxID=32597 RepID=A0A7J6LK76_PEROL|nr:hypothetical protein FOL46_006603 [Perkinsus olseni]